MASVLHHFSTVSSGSDSAEELESEPGSQTSEVHLLPSLFAVSSVFNLGGEHIFIRCHGIRIQSEPLYGTWYVNLVVYTIDAPGI